MKFETVVGIDEVGRGPLAGPVAVCALAICKNKNLKNKNEFADANFKNFKDSKKLSHLQRLKWLEKIEIERKKGNIFYHISLESNKIIDSKGISFAINKAIADSLKKLDLQIFNAGKMSKNYQIFLDGGLKAPTEYKNQETVIKGDEKVLAIALASIVAKVFRDKLMTKYTSKYPDYGFEEHKGYGTKKHFFALRKMGLSPLHRKSFLKSLIFKSK